MPRPSRVAVRSGSGAASQMTLDYIGIGPLPAGASMRARGCKKPRQLRPAGLLFCGSLVIRGFCRCYSAGTTSADSTAICTMRLAWKRSTVTMVPRASVMAENKSAMPKKLMGTSQAETAATVP